MPKTDKPQNQDLSVAQYRFTFKNMKIKSINEILSERDPKFLDHWQRKILGCMRKCWKTFVRLMQNMKKRQTGTGAPSKENLGMVHLVLMELATNYVM